MELTPLPRISGITGRLVEAVAVPVAAGAAAGAESAGSNGSTDQDD